MVKFRKKTRRKLKRKSKQSIKVGGNKKRFYCYTKEQLDEIKRGAADAARPAGVVAAAAANETHKMIDKERENVEMGKRDQRKRERGNTKEVIPDQFPDQFPDQYLRASESSESSPPRGRQRLLTQQESLSEDEPEGRNKGGSKKRKRRKKKKTRKARGIIDDLRELCTTGRCGSPRPQTPTLRQVALTIEQNILDDLNKNEPKIALTSEQRRNIKALANHEAARIVNNSRSASKKKKKKKKKNL